MSSFIVSGDTLNKAVWAMTRDIGGNGWSASCEDCDELGQRILDMNVIATNYRYRNSEHIEPETSCEFRFKLKSYRWVDALKSLDCVRYQCTEGEVPKLELYQQIEKRIQDIRAFVVRSLPEYENAAWG
jgi:hypothetical protein